MKNFKLGIQLYSLRDEMEKDMEKTLKAVSEMGYECVEFAGYFGKSALEVKELCKKYNLEPVSAHISFTEVKEDVNKTIEYLKELGSKFYAIPYYSKEAWQGDVEPIISDIKELAEQFVGSGISCLYHNHDFEFNAKVDNKPAIEKMYEALCPELLCPELDLCWVNYSGNKPTEYLKKYAQYMEVTHVKDYFAASDNIDEPVYGLIGKGGTKAKENDQFNFKPIGYGIMDMKAIFEEIEKTNIQYVIVEQDMHPENTSLEDAKLSIDYIRSLGY